MKFRLLFVIMLCLLTGCSYVVPSSIKRETSMIRVDIETACDEAPPLQEKATKMLSEGDLLAKTGKVKEASVKYREAAEQAGEATEKVLRSYRRVRPHIRNLDNYMNRRASEKEK